VQKDYPHLVAGTSVARKMGFPDVILPGGKFPVQFCYIPSGAHHHVVGFLVFLSRTFSC